jgi:hypothetical protein
MGPYNYMVKESPLVQWNCTSKYHCRVPKSHLRRTASKCSGFFAVILQQRHVVFYNCCKNDQKISNIIASKLGNIKCATTFSETNGWTCSEFLNLYFFVMLMLSNLFIYPISIIMNISLSHLIMLNFLCYWRIKSHWISHYIFGYDCIIPCNYPI